MDLEQATNPLLGRIVSVALADVDATAARVYIAAEPPVEPVSAPAGAQLSFMDEADLVRRFWRVAESVSTLVSFNGEGFDLPFVETRGRILGETAGPWQRRKWPRGRHQDVMRMLDTGRGHLGSLELCCHAFGIPGPKGEHSGGDVALLYAEQRYQELATYNLGDVRATLELWKRLQPPA
jgi:predicted PolB exonuclease-like 3'-5' exonuclease